MDANTKVTTNIHPHKQIRWWDYKGRYTKEHTKYLHNQSTKDIHVTTMILISTSQIKQPRADHKRMPQPLEISSNYIHLWHFRQPLEMTVLQAVSKNVTKIYIYWK